MTDIVKKYYSKRSVVESYEKKRFFSEGGKLINNLELNSITSLLKKSTNSKKFILDAGAGTGRLTKELIKRGYNVISLDSSKNMIKILNKINPKRVKFGSILKIPFKKNRFDGITSLRVIFHLNEKEINKSFKEFNIVLKINGTLIFDTLNNISMGRIISLDRKLNHFYSEKFIKRNLEKNGFVVEQIKRKFIIPHGVYLNSPRFMIGLLYKTERLLEKSFLKNISTSSFWKAKKVVNI